MRSIQVTVNQIGMTGGSMTRNGLAASVSEFSLKMDEVVIVSYARTPMGSFNGSLASVSATDLGAAAVRGALTKIQLNSEHVEELIMGCVLQANLGQAPAKQVARAAGLPDSVVCSVVNKVCASGMKALAMATNAIKCGQAECIIVGGMENMSQVPFYVPEARKGLSYGDKTLVDGIARDGLKDAYNQEPMGIAAELCAATHGLTREAQDAYAIESFTRATNAWANGWFHGEIVPVEVKDRRGNKTLVTEDDTYKNAQFDKIPKLKPCFKADGTVTAATSSPLSDGACAMILMTMRKATALHLRPLARVLATADAEQDPDWFTTSPAYAIPKAIHRAQLTIDQMDYFEINEAFAAVALANMKLMDITARKDRVNAFGGAVALGHPLGCSGARIVITLMNVLQHFHGRFGAAGICNGGGGASAVVIENLVL